MNDPNGLMQFKGAYHLFYQHNPKAAEWGNMTWGHAVSPDLIHWTHLPNALYPDQPYDKDGVFSGCAVNNNGVPTLIYTGVHPEVQCIATSQDMIHWKKSSNNPVIPVPPAGLEITGFRDPSVWWDNGEWFMVVGSGIKDVGGAILLYHSKDLYHWDYLHPLCSGKKEETGENWECPNFFPLDDKWVLLVSPQPLMRTIYFVGRYENYRFVPEKQGEIDPAGYFYAPQVFGDDAGRRIMFGWSWEGRNREAQLAAGWAGVMTLPRVLFLNKDQTLHFEPAEELKTLRHTLQHFDDLEVKSDSRHLAEGKQLEALIVFDQIEAASVGLKVRCSVNGEEETQLIYDGVKNTISIDRTHSSLTVEDVHDVKVFPFVLGDGEKLTFHLFVDNSIIELYVNYRLCMTSRIYPVRPDSLGLKVFAADGSARIKSADIWSIDSTLASELDR
jgi:beta-fructofuranosidase